MSAVAATGPGARFAAPRARIRDFADNHRSATIVISLAIAAVLMTILPKIPPLSLIQNEAPWFDAFRLSSPMRRTR